MTLRDDTCAVRLFMISEVCRPSKVNAKPLCSTARATVIRQSSCCFLLRPAKKQTNLSEIFCSLAEEEERPLRSSRNVFGWGIGRHFCHFPSFSGGWGKELVNSRFISSSTARTRSKKFEALFRIQRMRLPPFFCFCFSHLSPQASGQSATNQKRNTHFF